MSGGVLPEQPIEETAMIDKDLVYDYEKAVGPVEFTIAQIGPE